MRKQQKEQAEKERMRLENERRREKEEEDALEKARYIFFLYKTIISQQKSTQYLSQTFFLGSTPYKITN